MVFKDFEYMNSTFLAKQAWRMLHNPDLLWCSVMKAKYFPTQHFCQAARGRGGSWAWSSILHGKDVILNIGAWQIANGQDIDIRKDRWIG